MQWRRRREILYLSIKIISLLFELRKMMPMKLATIAPYMATVIFCTTFLRSVCRGGRAKRNHRESSFRARTRTCSQGDFACAVIPAHHLSFRARTRDGTAGWEAFLGGSKKGPRNLHCIANNSDVKIERAVSFFSVLHFAPSSFSVS